MRQAGFAGDFLEYSDPLCEGPVPDRPNLIEARAHFLAQAYGWFKGKTEQQFANDLRDSEQRLAAAHRYQRVVLWFEHDSYDQLVLARCLSRLAGGPLPGRVELICIDRHPSVTRFIGLGQLTPEVLASIWPMRTSVTPSQMQLGRAIWAALRRPDPSCLAAIAATGTPALPFAAAALSRQLQELPGVHDGLSMTQRLCLQILAEAPTSIGRMFAALTQGRELLPFLGDLMLLHIVRQMQRTRPAVLMIGAGAEPFQRVARITRIGHEVVAGRRDYLSLNPGERWVGGVVVDGQWRWDAATSGLVRATPPR